MNHVQDLISLSHEPPVQDFISAVHRNSAASGLFIQAIQSRCENLSTVSLLGASCCQSQFSLPEKWSIGIFKLLISNWQNTLLLFLSFSQMSAHHSEENSSVFGRDPPQPVGCCADAVCGQAFVYSAPCAGSHG